MRVFFWSLIFLFTPKIGDALSSTPSPGNPVFAGWPGSSSNPQSPSGSSPSPGRLKDLLVRNRDPSTCNRTKVRSGAPDAHSTCHNECLAVKVEMSTICNANLDNKIMKYFCNNCGMVTEGKCNAAFYFLICWCHTPKEFENQRSTPLVICRSGIQIMHQVIKRTTAASDVLAKNTKKQTKGHVMSGKAAVEAVAMHQSSTRRLPTRPRSPRPLPGTRVGTHPSTSLFSDHPFDDFSAGPSSPPSAQEQEEDFNSRPDGQREGGILWTDARVSGNDVRAMLDTGSSFTMIHQQFSNNMVRVGQTSGRNASGQQFSVLGRTTIYLEIKRGVTIPVTGFVTDRKHELLLGTDFFVSYAAKLNIPDGTMEILIGQTRVTVKTKFRAAARDEPSMNEINQWEYTDLCISARLNRLDTKVVIDTGSSYTFVDQKLVNVQTLYPFPRPGFLGGTYVDLLIGSRSLSVPVLVPVVMPPRSLVTGNDFIKKYVELIDFESKLVTLRFPDSSGYSQVITPAFVMKSQ